MYLLYQYGGRAAADTLPSQFEIKSNCRSTSVAVGEIERPPSYLLPQFTLKSSRNILSQYTIKRSRRHKLSQYAI